MMKEKEITLSVINESSELEAGDVQPSENDNSGREQPRLLF